MDRREMMALVSSAAVISAAKPEVKTLEAAKPIALVCKATIPIDMRQHKKIMKKLGEIKEQIGIPVLFAAQGFDFEVVDLETRRKR